METQEASKAAVDKSVTRDFILISGRSDALVACRLGDEDEWRQSLRPTGLTVDGEEGSKQRRDGRTLVECRQMLLREA